MSKWERVTRPECAWFLIDPEDTRRTLTLPRLIGASVVGLGLWFLLGLVIWLAVRFTHAGIDALWS